MDGVQKTLIACSEYTFEHRHSCLQFCPVQPLQQNSKLHQPREKNKKQKQTTKKKCEKFSMKGYFGVNKGKLLYLVSLMFVYT